MKKLNVLITGASSGIGFSAAKAICGAGHNVFGLARRIDNLQKLSEECADLNGSFLSFIGDVKNDHDIENAVKSMIDEFGSIDVVIPNAGLGHFNPLEKGTMEEWRSMVDVNITGVLKTIHSCLPHLLNSNGHVVNIGSVAARQVFQNSGVYCATKHFVLAMSESLRIEFGNKIAVTTINPGAVNTEFIGHTANESLREEYKPRFDSGMNPNFIANAILEAIESGGKGIYSEITIRPDIR